MSYKFHILLSKVWEQISLYCKIKRLRACKEGNKGTQTPCATTAVVMFRPVTLLLPREREKNICFLTPYFIFINARLSWRLMQSSGTPNPPRAPIQPRTANCECMRSPHILSRRQVQGGQKTLQNHATSVIISMLMISFIICSFNSNSHIILSGAKIYQHHTLAPPSVLFLQSNVME